MNRPRLCEWLPGGSGPYVRNFKREIKTVLDQVRESFPGALPIPEVEAIDRWLRVMDRIDAIFGGQMASSRACFVREYLRPSAIEVSKPLPSAEGYVLLVEEFPNLAFMVGAADLPPLESIAVSSDLLIVPLPKPTWLLSVSHENPWLPPLEFNLRLGRKSIEKGSGENGEGADQRDGSS